MEDIKDYSEYEQLYRDDLVVAVRGLLKRIENCEAHNLDGSKEHNALINYFNRFALHKKIRKEQFKTWNKLLRLPPMFYDPIRIVDELNTDVDTSILPGDVGVKLWKKVMNQDTDFTYYQVCKVYEMLGQSPPSPDEILAVQPQQEHDH